MTTTDSRVLAAAANLAKRNGKPAAPPPPPPPTGSSPVFMRAARWTAAAMTAGIAAVAFVLSYSSLCGLARAAGYGSLAGLWPIAVDGAIIQSSVALVALSALPGQRRHRWFFGMVLAVSAAASVSGNIARALLPAGDLPPVLSAVVACVAPLALLASTHGVAALVRVSPQN